MMLKRRKNIYSIFIFILLILVLLTACNSSKKTITEDVGDAKWDTGNNVGEKWKQGQYQFRGLAESESGYYDVISNSSGNLSLLYFFDKSTGKSAVLCDQANCKHNEEKCPAYLPTTLTGFCYYYLFLHDVIKNEIYYFDKSKLGTNDHEWIKSEVIK